MADQTPTGGQKTLASEVLGIVDKSMPVTNPKRVIRTFASDVAQLTGASVPEPRPAPKPASPTPPPAPRPEPVRPLPPVPSSKPTLADVVSGIEIPETSAPTPHLPPLVKQGVPKPNPFISSAPRGSETRPVSKPVEQPREWERIVEKAEPSWTSKLFSFIFGMNSTPAPKKYVPPPAPIWQKPREPEDTKPSAPTFKTPEAAADDTKEREAVLTRLRSRVETYQATQPIAPPVFPTPRPEYQPAARAAYVPPQQSTPSPAEPERLRTYTEDFSNRIDTQQASAFSVYAAQADSAQGATPIPQQKKQSMGLAYALGGAVLVIGGSLVLYYAYTYFAGNQPVAVVNTAPPTVLTGDDQAALAGTDGALMSKLADAANATLPIGNVRILYLAATATTSESGGALIKALALPAPDILLRNIGESSTVGVVHAGDQTRVFFVLSATSYERTFAGMLSWEATMGGDLAQLYPAYPAPVVPAAPVATTTTKTGKAVVPTPIIPATPVQPHFVDEVVDSHDVRAFKDANGKTILLYGYRDQNTLLIARDETAFSVLLARLSATRTQ